MINQFEFWKDWKNVIPLEKKAIKEVKFAKKIILKNILKKEIVSIYVKGSLTHRQLTKKSDVDVVIILKSKKYINKIKKLKELYKNKFKLELEIGAYTLGELKTGKRIKNFISKTPPHRFVEHLKALKLIYGKELNQKEFFIQPGELALKEMINMFNRKFLPWYYQKKIGFSDITKQVFWLTYDEQKAQNKNPSYEWKKLENSIKDKNHIVHEALRLRLNPTKDKKIREKFIIKLKKHLNNLQKN